jgi:hypothetical protein
MHNPESIIVQFCIALQMSVVLFGDMPFIKGDTCMR